MARPAEPEIQRSITRLDQIPDEELDILAGRGFTGLWLIGVWERSDASRRIKHLNGNTDALASAYSLNSYEIARELGGDDAYVKLKERALRRGIRLASDMVPNHMGIDSTWVINQPDWFLRLRLSAISQLHFQRSGHKQRRPGGGIHRGWVLDKKRCCRDVQTVR